MIEIHHLTSLDAAAINRIITGYTSHETFTVTYSDTPEHTTFSLQKTPLPQPFVKQFEPADEATVQRYNQTVTHGYSYGAYDGDLLIGLLVGEPHFWNHTIWVHEFHIAEGYRQQGIGTQLMAAVSVQASQNGFRALVCETQNTNAPAIHAYRRLGFRPEGIDIAYYTNQDYPGGEVAVFMKKRLG